MEYIVGRKLLVFRTDYFIIIIAVIVAVIVVVWFFIRNRQAHKRTKSVGLMLESRKKLCGASRNSVNDLNGAAK